jgi:hypothetical protein
MDEITPPPLDKAPVLDATIWKIILAPLGALLLAALVYTVASNAAAVFLWLAGFGMLIASIWAAVVLGQRIGQTTATKIAWGLLLFCVLQFFYIGVSVAGCFALLAAQ